MPNRASLVVLLALMMVRCGGGRDECGFVYRDRACSAPTPGVAPACAEIGDGLCHATCASDADCPADHPFCRELGLYAGGDFNCNDKVLVCRAEDRDDCRR